MRVMAAARLDGGHAYGETFGALALRPGAVEAGRDFAAGVRRAEYDPEANQAGACRRVDRNRGRCGAAARASARAQNETGAAGPVGRGPGCAPDRLHECGEFDA